MAKRAATSASPTVPSKIEPTTWGSGETMFRVHDAIYAVDQFNPSPKGNARFSPILDSSGNVIPTLYAATTPRGALMESVFRDVPYRTGFKHIDSKRLEGRVCSTLLFQADFELLDLSCRLSLPVPVKVWLQLILAPKGDCLRFFSNQQKTSKEIP
jgi:hypothetical protein